MTKIPSEYKQLTPGEIIRDLLNQADWTQEDLARVLDISTKHVNELVKDKKAVSFEIVNAIGTAFNLPDEDLSRFAKRNTIYRLEKLQKDNEIQMRSRLYSSIPVGEMIKKNWIKNPSNLKTLVSGISQAIGSERGDIDSILNTIENQSEKLPVFRNIESNRYTPNTANLAVWTLISCTQARKIKDIPSYNKEKLKSLFSQISTFTNYKKKADGVSEFLENLNNTGVKFLILSHLTKTYSEGAAFSCDGSPVIALTGRTDRFDTFWFNIAHEIAHVLHDHHKEGIMVDGDNSLQKNNQSPQEILANEEASKALKRDEIIKHFKRFSNYIQEDEVLEFSNIHNIHSSIVVSRLAWEGLVSWSIIHRFKDSILDKIPRKFIWG